MFHQYHSQKKNLPNNNSSDDHVIPDFTNLDKDEIQLRWLENVNAALTGEKEGDSTNLKISW